MGAEACVELRFRFGYGDAGWETRDRQTNAPALVVSDLVKFVGLAPSKESLVGALREAGLS
jgi:hypothetical protein